MEYLQEDEMESGLIPGFPGLCYGRVVPEGSSFRALGFWASGLRLRV